MPFLILIIIAFILSGIFLIIYKFKKKKLTSIQKQTFSKISKNIQKLPSFSEQIMEYDKLLDATLKAYGYKNSLGNKLKQNPGIFKNLNEIWFAHKLRNRIAHEIGYKPNEQEAKKAINIFKKSIMNLIE